MQTLASLWVTTTTTVLRPFFRDYLGEPVPEDNFWTLWCKGRLTEADTLTIWLGATASRLTIAHLHHPPYFYRPDALPVAQPTVLKHWRQLAHSDYGEDVRVLINGVTCTISVPYSKHSILINLNKFCQNSTSPVEMEHCAMTMVLICCLPSTAWTRKDLPWVVDSGGAKDANTLMG